MKILLFACALWASIYIAPSNGHPHGLNSSDFNHLRQSGYKVKDIGPMTKNIYRIFRATCNNTCDVKLLEVKHNSTSHYDLIIYGATVNRYINDTDFFCYGTTKAANPQICDMTRGKDYANYQSNKIYIYLIIKDYSIDELELGTNIDGLVDIIEVEDPIKDYDFYSSHSGNIVKDIGSIKGNTWRSFRAICNDTCTVRLLEVRYNWKAQYADIDIYGGNTKHKKSDTYIFCQGETMGNPEICDMTLGDHSGVYQSDKVYIYLFNWNEFIDQVELRTNIDGLVDIIEIDDSIEDSKPSIASSTSSPLQQSGYQRQDVGSFKRYEVRYFRATCKKACGVNHLEVEFQSTSKYASMSIYAGVLKGLNKELYVYCQGRRYGANPQKCSTYKYKSHRVFIELRNQFYYVYSVILRTKIDGLLNIIEVDTNYEPI